MLGFFSLSVNVNSIDVYKRQENLQEYVFSGKRIKRGLYQTSKGYQLNADCNGALNILRKSKVRFHEKRTNGKGNIHARES